MTAFEQLGYPEGVKNFLAAALWYRLGTRIQVRCYVGRRLAKGRPFNIG